MTIIIFLKIILAVIIIVVAYKFRCKKIIPDRKKGIFITGCDSGIGFSLAVYCKKLGFTVFAACLKNDGEGLLQLKKLENIHVIEMDVTNSNSIQSALTSVNKILENNPDIKLETLVNNAGVMIFGEFPWQTIGQIEKQIQINLIGAMRVTQTFLPHIRTNRGKIVNICSHCSKEAVPGLSVYASTKAGLLAWNDALRLELKKFQISVISVMPGSFPHETQIFAKHSQNVEEMQHNMSPEDWKVHGNYFKEYHHYLSFIRSPNESQIIQDDSFYNIFNDTLLSVHPKSHYVNSPPRYLIYHFLFTISPVSIRDWLMVKFANLPEWRQ